MSKITFRADEDLIRQLETFDASKSEVMREALREYLDDAGGDTGGRPPTDNGGSIDDSLDDLIAERVDAILDERLGGHLGASYTPREPQDVNVNISLSGDSAEMSHGTDESRKTPAEDTAGASDTDAESCKQCGEDLSPSDVYCPNCGEKASHRVFCECGDELRSDWGFCPSCGRRTPAADVLKDS
ncbi:DZR domain protein [Natronomonas pharaonis DSM 2160]|uniref:DZR domain protein n=1 Tax=Natronomonas pharaonis (strain ATCC 35678 / DSM 2160 / CIP 103997 / JCM 8858 / NBRC 14720 / NCIMB 2260 / Gabara) TaxID=348780 RepID=A0A1U7EZM6_NATPD|nr:zinc ribbon domain-containing protein [Natronomonas pharaonis]CAI50755.1 DZR domain protein [Natronomonas pharaonis DSM 2160]